MSQHHCHTSHSNIIASSACYIAILFYDLYRLIRSTHGRLKLYKGIVFDMDGTLVDSMPAHMEAWRVTCENYGYPFDLDYMYSLGGVPTRQTVVILNDKFNMDHDPTEVARYKRESWEAMKLEPVIIESTMAVFNHYRPQMAIGIGTGAERPQAEHLLTAHGLHQSIDSLDTPTYLT